MSMPRVSVIVPCFNAGPMLEPALASIVGQTHPAIELIVVDNASTDASAAVAEAALAARPEAVPFRALRNAGRQRRAKRRLRLGERRLCELDTGADDLIDADKIARQVAALEASPASDIAYGDYTSRWLPPDYPPRRQTRTLAPVKDQLQRVLGGVWVPPHLYLIRRAAADRLQEAEAWAPGRMAATDVEYSAVAALMGMKFLHVPGAHVTYNIWSKSQISGRTPFDHGCARSRRSSPAAERPRRRRLGPGRAHGASPTAPEPGLDGVAAAAGHRVDQPERGARGAPEPPPERAGDRAAAVGKRHRAGDDRLGSGPAQFHLGPV